MLKKKDKLFSAAAALILLLTQSALPAFAAGDIQTQSYVGEDGSVIHDGSDGEITDYSFIDDETMRERYWELFEPEDEEYDTYHRNYNSTINWTYKRGVLTITGTGPMNDYKYDLPPWSELNIAIEEIRIGEGITRIGDWSFCGLERLEEFYMADTVTEIGENAIANNYMLTKIELSENLRCIEDGGLANNGFTELELPESLEMLYPCALYENPMLTKIVLPDGLKAIGSRCFSYNGNLTECEIPDSVQYIGDYIFEGDVEFIKQHLDDYFIVGDGFLVACFKDDPVLDIPEGVKAICGGALDHYNFDSNDLFDGSYHETNTTVREINLPESLIKLNPMAFYEMSSLEKVVMPRKLESIGMYAFAECPSLTEVVMPEELESIGENAFLNCTSLAKLDVPETVTEIGAKAFTGTAFLKNFKDYAILGDGILCGYNGSDKQLTVPDGVKVLNPDSIYYLDIVTVSLPESVRVIKSHAIRHTSLAEIHLNEGLEVLESGAIEGSTLLETINIPESLQSFEEDSVNAHLKYVIGKGEAAEEFAALYQCELYEEPPALPDGPDYTLDPSSECWSFGNFADVFGNRYYFTEHDADIIRGYSYRDSLLDRKDWTGACFGMTSTILLVKAGLITPDQIQKGAKSLADIRPTEEVQSFINYYHSVQYLRAFSSSATTYSEAGRIWNMIETAKRVKHGELPFMLSFQNTEFGHAVIGYGQEDGEWTFNDQDYDGRIIVWDPNFPNEFHEQSCLYYNNKTFDYCIPHYKVYYNHADLIHPSGKLLYTVNDLKRLDPYPYEFETESTVYQNGDCNCDGEIDVSDAVLLARFCAEDSKAMLTIQGRALADVNDDSVITPEDVIGILRIIAKFNVVSTPVDNPTLEIDLWGLEKTGGSIPADLLAKYKGCNFRNVTPEWVTDKYEIRVWKDTGLYNVSYLEYENELYYMSSPLGDDHHGTLSFAAADLNQDTVPEIYFTFSFDDARCSEIGYFDPTTCEITYVDYVFTGLDPEDASRTADMVLQADGGKLAVFDAVFVDPENMDEQEPIIKGRDKIGELEFEFGMIIFKKTA